MSRQSTFLLVLLGPMLCAGLLAGCSRKDSPRPIRLEQEAVEQVAALLQDQAEAWTRGDLEAFTSIYSDDCAFLSPTGLTRGRQQVLDRYRTRYPDRAAMGSLSLQIIEMHPAAVQEEAFFGVLRTTRIDGMSVAARWTLTYPDREDATGLTLLVLRRLDGGWQIVEDASM